MREYPRTVRSLIALVSPGLAVLALSCTAPALIPFVAVLALASACDSAPSAGGPAASASDATTAELAAVSAAMDSVYARFSRAYALGEPDSVVVLYTAAPLYLPAQGDIRRGREELRAQFGFLESTRERGGTARISFESVDRGVSGNVAFDVGYYSLHIERADGTTTPASRGKFATIWKRGDDGAWRIHVDSYSPAPPR